MGDNKKGEEALKEEGEEEVSYKFSRGGHKRRYPSLKGMAYIASADFLAKGVIFLTSFVHSLITYEMVVIYGAHLDTHILLFFQSVFAIPVFLLGVLVFLGIEKESFNLVLYPSLMLLFLVLLRYGAELALIFIHWEDHADFTVALHFGLDLFAIAVLLLYVYFCLASRSLGYPFIDLEQQALLRSTVSPTRKAPAPPPPPEDNETPLPLQPPPRPPPSPKFNYKLRRGVGQIDAGSPEGAMLDELDKQKQRNSGILMPEVVEEEHEGDGQELSVEEKKAKTQSLNVYETEPKRRSLLLETDLDAKEEGEGSKLGAEVEKNEGEEEDGEWEWEYEEEEEAEEDVKNPDDDRDKESPSPQILSSSFKTTAV